MPALRVDGVDISHHQSGQLDLRAAKRAGVKWLYHKATEGSSIVDSNYDKRRRECAEAGLPFGAYHFARPDRGDAVQEARFFAATARPKPGDLRPALDLETTEGLTSTQIRRWAQIWLQEVERITGVKPVIYTPYDLGTVQQGHVLWRPRYNPDNREPEHRWDIFQFSDGRLGRPNQIAGLGHVDLNHMRAGLEVKDLLIPRPKAERPKKPEPVPEPAPKPTPPRSRVERARRLLRQALRVLSRR